jgi:cystathionine gamma-synthase
VCSSLTKIFSGVGNVLAGSIFVNPTGRYAASLKEILSSDVLEVCSVSAEDLAVLEYNSRDFIPRAYLCSKNALELSKRLLQHPHIKTVYYPGVRNHGDPDTIYSSYLQQPSSDDFYGEPGYGCLLSILLKDEAKTPAFFDHLEVCKGPSLGTNFTLACPYTLLAHYQELPWLVRHVAHNN